MQLTPLPELDACRLGHFPFSDSTTKSDVKTESEKVTATSEESSIPTPSPTSSVQQGSNSTEATTTTSQRPVTTALVVTPTTSVPDLMGKWSGGTRGQEVELITALLGLAVAFVV
ncbi:uncharacterized protein PG998_004229 [Apiospora kogelbergensis]|uniref:uncharacterized protein n=1 Tax=Apiospora kogelbergensis TaxID=1337665 RepID=UPI00312DC3B7